MTLKNRIWKRVPFWLAAVFLLLSYLGVDTSVNSISDRDIASIEKVLHNLQNEGKKIVSDIALSSRSNIDSICPANLNEKGLYLFITDSLSTEIKYWSYNLPVTVDKLKNVGENAQYLFFGNGRHVAQAQWHDGYKYIILILIEREYWYQNRFLRNGTNPVFGFPENLIVQPLDADIGIPVKGVDGMPLFVVNLDIPPMDAVNIALIFRILSFILVLIGLIFVFFNPALYCKNPAWLAVFVFLLAGLRITLGINTVFPLGGLYLFSPMLYADSMQLPSLGALLLHVLFLLVLIIGLFCSRKALTGKIISLSNNRRMILYLVSCLLTALFLCFAEYIAKSLVINSSISFKIYKINNISIYMFVAYLVLGIIFAQICLLVGLQSLIFSTVKKRLQYILPVSIALITLLLTVDFEYDILLITGLYAAINFLIAGRATRRFSLFIFVCIVALNSLYISWTLIVHSVEREHRKREMLAHNFLSERDPEVEVLLKEINNKIPADPYIKSIIHSDKTSSIYNILADRYFRGYFQRYDLSVTVCNSNANLHIIDEDRYEHCIDFFEKQYLSLDGIPLSENSNFHFMNHYLGRIYYFGSFKFADEQDTVFLFVDLYLKHAVKAGGYPELLKLDSRSIDFDQEDYSCAKYANGLRVACFGVYEYSFELDGETENRGSGFFEKNGYSHCIFNTGKGNAVIVSQPKQEFSEIISIFSYSFVIFFMIFLLSFTMSGIKPAISQGKNSYRRRISMVILAGITGSLTTLAISVIAYNIAQSEKNNIEDIRGRMQSIMNELEDFFDKKINSETIRELEQTLFRLSNAFYTDLNVYSLSGDLICSSRNEIFEKNLTGTKMNREAFYELAVAKQSKYIHTERIGAMNYFSSYATCYNRDGVAVAFLNLPYFDKQFKVRNELLSLIGAIINIYIFLIMIGIALSVFVSNQITRPLDLVRRKMAKLNLNEQPETIDYKANDELGELVRAYNRMIGELAESAKIMAESERESAWREMARQIAHEIKNPLTPMKLNIQLALLMKKQNREGWQEKMESAMASILEQIDTLSSIASEFSDFARTGKVALTEIDWVESINSVIALFSGYRNIKIIFDCDTNKKYTIKANSEQMLRVMTNLVKNSIQATETVDNPEIRLLLTENDGVCELTVADNGTGISDEEAKYLFRPNFTTKSGGTGLGLAISKGIIESFGGTISFVQSETGACFKIILKQ
ncbi:MAG: HAMP domain-containing protein [Prevotellaceae bacterium]|jgi:signal transduction histidine kinase|nr:HAMP domain-containing protein [Prevotellaceae bacterium]